MKVVHVRADGHIAEPARRLGIVAREVGNGRCRGELPHTGPQNEERARAAVFRQVVPTLALRRKVEVAAVQAQRAGLGQGCSGLFLARLAVKGFHPRQEFAQRLAALRPPVVNTGLQPWCGVFTGVGVEAHDGMVARVGNAAVQVVPHEGVVSVRGIRNRRVTRRRGHQVVGEAADVRVVQCQRHVSHDRSVLGHRRSPAHNAFEALSVRVLPTGKRLFLGLKGYAQRLGLGWRDGPNDPRRGVGTDHVRHVNVAGLHGLEGCEIPLRLAPGVLFAGHIAQVFGQHVGQRDLDTLFAVQSDKGHLVIQRSGHIADHGLRWAGMKVLAVLTIAGAGQFGGRHRLHLGYPGFAVWPEAPFARTGQHAGAVAHERLVLGLVWRQGCGQQHVAIAVVQEIGHGTRGVGGQALQFFAGSVVERLDRFFGKGLAHFGHGGLDLDGNVVRLIGKAAPQVVDAFPRKQRQQDQRHHLDQHKQGDQLGSDAKLPDVKTTDCFHGVTLCLCLARIPHVSGCHVSPRVRRNTHAYTAAHATFRCRHHWRRCRRPVLCWSRRSAWA